MFNAYLFIPYFNAQVARNSFLQRLHFDCICGTTVLYGAYDTRHIQENAV